MKFVDYKCLESLLIEEEEIATEGLADKAKSIFSKVINILKSFLKYMINMIKKMIMTIKNKIKTKNKSYTVELKLKTSEVTDIMLEANNYSTSLQRLINEIYGLNGGTMSEDKIHEYVNKLRDYQDSVIEKARQFHNKYNGEEYSIAASAADALLRSLYDTQQKFEAAYNKVDKMAKMALDMSLSGQNAETFSNMYSIMETFAVGIQQVSKALTQVNNIIINAKYDYGKDQVTDSNGNVVKTMN